MNEYPDDFVEVDVTDLNERKPTDPMGAIVTGEMDDMDTPSVVDIDVPPDAFGRGFATDFVVGLGLGVIIFALGWLCAASLVGMN